MDTGHKNPDEHTVKNSIIKTFKIAGGKFGDPPCLMAAFFDPGTGGGGGGTGAGNDDDDETSGFSFIVTRRMIQSCGESDDNGLFKLKNVSSTPKPPYSCVGELFLPVRDMIFKSRSIRR